MVESNVERGASGIGQNLLVSFAVALIVLETDFVAATASEPAAVVVRLIHRNAVKPGLQTALSAEGADRSEHLQEDLLYDVGGIAWIVQQTINKVIDGLLKTIDQRLVGGIVASAKTLDQQRIDRRHLGYRPGNFPGSVQFETDSRVGHRRAYLLYSKPKTAESTRIDTTTPRKVPIRLLERLRNQRNQFYLDTRGGVRKLGADGAAGWRVLWKVLRVCFVEGVLLGLHIGQEHRHLDHMLESGADCLEVGLMRLHDGVRLFPDVAAER